MMQNKRTVPEWSDLHRDLLEQIAIKLNEFEDFTAFRGVCTSWRVAVSKDEFVYERKLPLLILPEELSDNNNVREFYSLGKKKIVSRMVAPEANGKRCTSVGFGWILTVALSDGELSLVNSMFSAKIQLPNMMAFPGYEDPDEHEKSFAKMAVLSANPSQSSDFVLMIISTSNLGLWRNGDRNWTKIETRNWTKYVANGRYPRCFGTICYFKEKMYVVDSSRAVWMCDPYLSQPAEVILTVKWNVQFLEFMEYLYLVESSKGELLLIVKDPEYLLPKSFYLSRGEVPPGKTMKSFKIDTVKMESTRIESLDGDAIFIGLNSAVCVAASDFPGRVYANNVYFLNKGVTYMSTRSEWRKQWGLDVEPSSFTVANLY